MNYVDRNKLDVEMVKRGISKKQLANELSISYPALYKKLAYKKDFSETQICVLKSIFGDNIFSC